MKKILLSTVVSLAMIGPAMAGSLIVPDADIVPPPAAPELKWDGFYVGAFAGSGFDGSTEIAGLWAGYNFRNGDFVYGGELEAYTYDTITQQTDGFAKARLGYVIGENAMVFGTAGVGQWLTGGSNLQLVGFGAEFGVGETATIRVEYDIENLSNLPVLDGPGFLKLGAVWNF